MTAWARSSRRAERIGAVRDPRERQVAQSTRGHGARGLIFVALSALLVLAWPWLIEWFPGLLPPGIGIVGYVDPLVDHPGDAELDRHLQLARGYALAFWWMVLGISFIALEPHALRRAFAAWRDQSANAADDALAKAARSAGRAAREAGQATAVVPMASAIGVVGSGFTNWLAERLAWLVGRGVLCALLALLIAGSITRFAFAMMAMVVLWPLWVWLHKSWVALTLGIVFWLPLGGFHALVHLGIAARYDWWNQRWIAVDVRGAALVIWVLLMLGCLARAWFDHRREADAQVSTGATRAALARARARVAARQRDASNGSSADRD